MEVKDKVILVLQPFGGTTRYLFGVTKSLKFNNSVLSISNSSVLTKWSVSDIFAENSIYHFFCCSCISLSGIYYQIGHFPGDHKTEWRFKVRPPDRKFIQINSMLVSKMCCHNDEHSANILISSLASACQMSLLWPNETISKLFNELKVNKNVP